MLIEELEQGSHDWKMVRLGKPSASRFCDIITPAKGDYSKTAENYMHELLAEWLANEPQETYSNMWMQRGTEIEPEARAFYELQTDADVQQVGFCWLDENKQTGCSPDGLVGDDGLVEIKVPKPSTHVKYLLAGDMPVDYKPQIQGQLWITDRAWCDFISYCPGVAPLLVRVYRDDKYIEKLSSGVNQFIETMLQKQEQLKQKGYTNE